MAESLEHTYRGLLEAVSFAARAHRHQLRKDGQTPYVAHVVRVCLIVRHVFGVADPTALTAAVLHDAIEDTDTDFDDLEERFGRGAAAWAAALCKDKRLPEDAREEDYVARLVAAPWQVKVCKLADVFDNLMDSRSLKPEQAAKSRKRWRQYIDALGAHLPDEARPAYEIVERLYAELQAGQSV
jgi:guanosine-3',5'-bis(diphosphate) 3'-pyrophosphohydrolase